MIRCRSDHSLLQAGGAPGAATWRNEKAEPRFVLNLPAFLDDAGGFDIPAYAEAVSTAIRALEGIKKVSYLSLEETPCRTIQ